MKVNEFGVAIFECVKVLQQSCTANRSRDVGIALSHTLSGGILLSSSVQILFGNTTSASFGWVKGVCVIELGYDDAMLLWCIKAFICRHNLTRVCPNRCLFRV